MVGHTSDKPTATTTPQGFNLTKRMPLWVRPRRGLTRDDVHELLSSKYEGSWRTAALASLAAASTQQGPPAVV